MNNALGDPTANNSSADHAEASAAGPDRDPSQPSDSIPMSRYTIVNNPFAGVFQRRESARRNEKRSAPYLMVAIVLISFFFMLM